MGMGTWTMACLLLAAGTQPLDTWPLNQRGFDIPIRIDQARRAEIRELILLASTDQGRTWNKVAVASPEQQQFAFQAPTDGVYWFSICVVDRQGNQDPPDPFQAQVGQKVLVDTVRPELRIVSAERQGDDVVVRWEAIDQNLDLGTLRLQYRTTETPPGVWNPVHVAPAVAGQALFRPAGVGAVSVRLEVQDLAKNASSAQAEVAGGMATTAYTTTGQGKDWTPIHGGQPAVVRENPPRERPENVAPLGTGTNSPHPGASVVASSQPGLTGVSPAVPAPPRPPRGPAPPAQMVNSNRVTLDYEVARFGPSGVGSVDLYVTRDEGRTWQRIGGEANLGAAGPADLQGTGPMRRSLTVDLPEDGVYGFHLVVRSGAGLGKPPPQNGDPPQMRVEVDRTAPEARLYAPEPDPRRRDSLILRWTATDRNLTANPVTLQSARQQGGPWENIGPAELPNTGQFVWQVPPTGIPPRVYLRLTVRDTAGNNGVAETTEPVLVDLTEPEVRLIGVAGSPR